MVWISQFDLFSHMSFTGREVATQLATQVETQLADAAPQVLQAIETPQAERPHWYTGAILVPWVAGAALSCLGYKNTAAPEMDDAELARESAREALNKAYRVAIWRIRAQEAFQPKPCDLKMTIETFLQQAHVLRPKQLALELQARGCERVEDLKELLEHDSGLWAKMRMHSGHQKQLLQNLQFTIDGSWQQNSLVPAPIACKSMRLGGVFIYLFIFIFICSFIPPLCRKQTTQLTIKLYIIYVWSFLESYPGLILKLHMKIE